MENVPSIVFAGYDGPVEACRQTLTELSQLFPSSDVDGTPKTRSKRRKVNATLAALAWPLKESKARKLLSELGQHKATISLALTTELRQVLSVIFLGVTATD